MTREEPDIVEAALHPERELPKSGFDQLPDARRTPRRAEGAVESMQAARDRG